MSITREAIIRPWGSPMANNNVVIHGAASKRSIERLRIARKPKRVRLEVCPQKGRHPWKVTAAGVTQYQEQTQAAAIARAVKHAHALVKAGGLVTLKIKRPNGEIRDERTYPRSSDPRRSKG